MYLLRFAGSPTHSQKPPVHLTGWQQRRAAPEGSHWHALKGAQERTPPTTDSPSLQQKSYLPACLAWACLHHFWPGPQICASGARARWICGALTFGLRLPTPLRPREPKLQPKLQHQSTIYGAIFTMLAQVFGLELEGLLPNAVQTYPKSFWSDPEVCKTGASFLHTCRKAREGRAWLYRKMGVCLVQNIF